MLIGMPTEIPNTRSRAKIWLRLTISASKAIAFIAAFISVPRALIARGETEVKRVDGDLSELKQHLDDTDHSRSDRLTPHHR